MRKLSVICLGIVFGLLCTTNVYSDGFGIHMGMNFADLTNLEEDPDLLYFNFGAREGFVGGIYYRFGLTRSFSIQPGVYYSQKGTKASFKETFNGFTYSFTLKAKIDYLVFPVLMKYRISPKAKVSPNLFVGPYVAFKTSAKGCTTLEADGMKETDEYDLEDVKGTDYGITFGLGLDVKIGKNKLIVDARYSRGLTRIWEYEDDPDMKNSVFTIMLGYAFK